MLLSTLRDFLIIVPSLVLAASSSQSTATPNALPSSLATLIPTCASQCVLTSITVGFPSSCTTEGNLDCLCSRYSASGFSLGEVALGCVFAACPEDVSNSTSVFTICAGQKSIVPATHTLLTVTWEMSSSKTGISSPAATTLDTRPTNSLQTPSVSASPASNLYTARNSQTAGPTQIGVYPSAAAAATTSSPSSEPSTIGPLTTGQIIGISVAGSATLIVVVGGIIAITCIQRKRDKTSSRKQGSRDEEKFDFGSQLPSTPSRQIMTPPPMDLKDPRRGVGGVGLSPARRASGLSPRRLPVIHLPRIQTSEARMHHKHCLSDERERSEWRNPDVPAAKIGLAISPESDSHQSLDTTRNTDNITRPVQEEPQVFENSNATAKAQQSSSHSLLAVPPNTRPESSASQMTLFEEDAKSYSDSVPDIPLPLPLRVGPRRGLVPAARLSPSNVKSAPPLKTQIPAPSFADEYSASPEGLKQPVLALKIPERYTKVPEAPSTLLSPIKVYAPPSYQSPQEQPAPTFSKPQEHARNEMLAPMASVNTTGQSRNVQGYLPRYYTRNVVADDLDKDRSPRLVDIRRPVSRPPEPNSGSKMVVTRSGRESAASFTTFESVDPEEPTPPEDDDGKQLTPVAESPINGLRYPKVPRPSNQTVPRSPGQKLSVDPVTTPASATPSVSLLAKRRGDKAAHDLERRLWVGTSNISASIYSRVSNISGHSRGSRIHSHSRTGSDGTLGAYQSRLPNMILDQRGPQSADMVQELKSPMWAPRITPTRRGDDLFLSVSKIYSD